MKSMCLVVFLLKTDAKTAHRCGRTTKKTSPRKKNDVERMLGFDCCHQNPAARFVVIYFKFVVYMTGTILYRPTNYPNLRVLGRKPIRTFPRPPREACDGSSPKQMVLLV